MACQSSLTLPNHGWPRTGESAERYEERVRLTASGSADADLTQALTTDGPLQAMGHPHGGMLVHKPLPMWAQSGSHQDGL